MPLLDAYPIIVTDRVRECRDFYTRWLGFQVAFEASWFVYLASGGERPHGIAFMAADHPSQPPGPFDSRLKYNLYSCLRIIPAHQRQHLLQAEEVIRRVGPSRGGG